MGHLLKNVNVRYTQLYFIELTRGQTIPKANAATKNVTSLKGKLAVSKPLFGRVYVSRREGININI
jgi:hypothetical protein